MFPLKGPVTNIFQLNLQKKCCWFEIDFLTSDSTNNLIELCQLLTTISLKQIVQKVSRDNRSIFCSSVKLVKKSLSFLVYSEFHGFRSRLQVNFDHFWSELPALKHIGKYWKLARASNRTTMNKFSMPKSVKHTVLYETNVYFYSYQLNFILISTSQTVWIEIFVFCTVFLLLGL